MRIVLGLILSLLFCGQAMATDVVTLLSAQAVSTGDTVYSSSFNANNAAGFAAMDIGLTGSGAIDVTQQCSANNSTWRTCVDTNGNTLGVVVATLDSSAYVQYDPALSPRIRFKVDSYGVNSVTLKYVWKEN